MDGKFNELKLTFNGIKNLREEINSIFDNLEQRVLKLKDLYKDFIDQNTTTLFIFGLDSFYFQNKLIDIELGDMKKFYDLIMNRMYCEYYKLYKIIIDYANNNMNDDQKFLDTICSKTNYPTYKDLEPYKKYEFLFISEIHDDIVQTLIAMNNYITNKKLILTSYQLRSNVGLNINNFVSSYEFELSSIESQLALFCSYVDFFHELHLKYMERFIIKIQILYGQVNHDIKFDEVSLTKKSDKKQFMNDMKNEVDKRTMKAIRSSIHVEQQRGELSSDSEESVNDKNEEIIDFNNRIKKINSISETIHQDRGDIISDTPFLSMPFISHCPSNSMGFNIIEKSHETQVEQSYETPAEQSEEVQSDETPAEQSDETPADQNDETPVEQSEEEQNDETQEEPLDELESNIYYQELSTQEQEDHDLLAGFTPVINKKNKPKKNKRGKKKK